MESELENTSSSETEKSRHSSWISHQGLAPLPSWLPDFAGRDGHSTVFTEDEASEPVEPRNDIAPLPQSLPTEEVQGVNGSTSLPGGSAGAEVNTQASQELGDANNVADSSDRTENDVNGAQVIPQSGASSPLSDIPDLPSLPFDSLEGHESPVASTSKLPLKTVQNGTSTAQTAETPKSSSRTGNEDTALIEKVIPSKESGSTSKSPSKDQALNGAENASAKRARTSRSPSKTEPVKRKRVKKEANEDKDDLESLSEDPLQEVSEVKAESSKQAIEKHKKAKRKVADGTPEGESDDGKKKRKREGKAKGKSRKMLDQVLGIDRSEEDHQEKIAPRARAWNGDQLKTALKGKDREVQMGICQKPRYAKWGKCTQCIAKQGGDSCRFRDFRTFPIDPETAEILGPGYFESVEWREEITPLPKEFNTTITKEYVRRIERTVAPLLLPLISRELRHIVKHKAIRREMDSAKHRSICDFCNSTIFGGWFFCKRCGRDFCLVCERYFSDSFDTMGESPWSIPDAARPRLCRCNGTLASHELKGDERHSSRFGGWHFRPDLQPVSRFDEDDLKRHWLAFADFVLEGQGGVGDKLTALGLVKGGDEVVGLIQDWTASQSSDSDAGPSVAMDEDAVNQLYTKITSPSVEGIPDPAELEDQSQKFLKIDTGDLDYAKFDFLWSKGEPLLVDKVGKGLKMSWTPDDFIERFGDQKAVVVDCEKNSKDKTAYESMKIEAFFTRFKDRENRSKKILKLKDWPQTDDFANTHPLLYNDFCDALPVPDYTRREGVLNLYAHFPPGPTRPDIGPKMYNAFLSNEGPDGKGSTSLHMDVADAVNVMLYASPRSDGQPGCAVWDIFRAEDADKLRAFLRWKFNDSHEFTDPIHSQLFYLHAGLRRELYEKYGVTSWRIYQYPGQAVFIPAGCAHQVCNLADCIKIALDFVSPHNVIRCQKLIQDFRAENFVNKWKNDVLQLMNVLWFAWLNTREIRQKWEKEDQDRSAAEADRAKHLAALANGEQPSDESGSDRPALAQYRHQSSGFLIPQISSARDEDVRMVDEDRAATLASANGGTKDEESGSKPDQGGRYKGTETNDSQASQPDKSTLSDVKKEAESGMDEKDPRALLRRQIGQKLLQATLDMAEPAPPPEGRNPSAKTKWNHTLPNKTKEATSKPRAIAAAKYIPPRRGTRSSGAAIDPNLIIANGSGIVPATLLEATGLQAPTLPTEDTEMKEESPSANGQGSVGENGDRDTDAEMQEQMNDTLASAINSLPTQEIEPEKDSKDHPRPTDVPQEAAIIVRDFAAEGSGTPIVEEQEAASTIETSQVLNQ